MADSLPEQKEGGDDGNPNTVVPQKDELSGLQCAPSGVCNEDPHQNEELTLHSTKLQEDESRSVGLHPAEAKAAKYSEETADNSGRPVVKDGSETAETFKKQSDETGRGPDESKLAKTTVSQAKDPPDRENSPAEGKMVVTEQNEAPPSEGASREILPVSTKSSETPIALNDNTSDHKPPCTPALPQTIFTENVFEKSGIPTETYNCSAVGCQESLKSSSNPTSLPSEKPPDSDLDSSSNVSGAPQQEKLTEALTESQDSSKSSIYSASSETAVIESSSTQSSSICSASDLCPASEVVHNVVDTPSQSSGSASASKSSSTPTQISSAQEESGNEVGMLVNQSQIKETESNSQTSKAQCPQGYVSAENKNQDQISSEKNDTVMEGEKIYAASEEPGNPRSLTGQSKMQVEQKESWNEVTNEMGTETLPLIVATHSLSQEQDAEKQSTGKGEPTALVSTEMEATKKKIIPSLESEPLKPVTIGSSLQPLEEIQEASVVEDTSFTTDMAIIDSSADEADSIGGLVINNVIGAADGVADFHPEEVETEKELTDISASAPQLGEGSESSDEHGPSAKRRRLENGPNSVEDKSNSAKKVILKVIPVQNGHGVWDSQKLQEVLLTKGTILLQIHASKESIELFEPDKSDKKVDFTAIMAETKDDDHDHMLSFGNVDPECDDPLAVGASHPETTSLPSYGAPYSHSHSRSTALQPAMSRPGFKHLQTPQQYHMKNEVLGLPPPLEFEEPQMGSPDWSGMESRTVAFPESQASPHSPVEEGLLPHSHGPESKISRVKVCPECGKVFHKIQSYILHVRSHRPPLNCNMCTFSTKQPKKLKMHMLIHKKDNPDNECFICHKYYISDVTLRVHQKKFHSVHECRYCNNKYNTEEGLRNHIGEEHSYTRKEKGYVKLSDPKQINFQTTNKVPDVDKSQLTCLFCKKISRNEYELNLHLAQHLENSSEKIGDGLLDKHDGLQKQKNQCHVSNGNSDSKLEFETEDVSQITDFGAAVKCEVESEEAADTVDKVEALPPVCTTSVKQPSPSLGQTLLICNTVGQPLSMMGSNTTLRSPTINVKSNMTRPEAIPRVYTPSFTQLSTTSGVPSGQTLLICNPVAQPLHMLRPRILLQPPVLASTNEQIVRPYTHSASAICGPSVQPSVCVPPDQPTTNHHNSTPVGMSAPKVTPSTSLSSNNQSSTASVFIPTQEEQAEKDEESFSFWCVSCPTAFLTLGDLKKHSLEAHNDLPFPKALHNKRIIKPLSEKSKESLYKKHKVKLGLPCDICGEVCCSNKALRKHKQKHRRSFNCPDCNIAYKFSHKLLRHQKLCHKDKFRCRFACGMLFDSYSEVVNHYKSVHDKDYSKSECPHCQKSFIYNASLMNHLEKCKACPPDKRPAHVCGNCEGFFPNVETYNNHAKICLPSIRKTVQSKNHVHGNVARKTLENTPQNLIESTIDCLENSENSSDCDSDTSDSSESNADEHDVSLPYEFRHKRLTTGYAKCKYCPNVLVEKDKDVIHILSWHKNLVKHMTVSPQKCKICGMIFKTDNSLCRHLLKHYSKLKMWDALVPQDILDLVTVKNYCWICKSTYRWLRKSDHGIKRDRDIEEALETEESDSAVVEPLRCEKCNQTFSTRKEFWIHVKVHISALPRTFLPNKLSQSSGNPRLLECAECQYNCGEMDELHKHLTIHFLEEIKEKAKSEKPEVVSK